jgi:ferredoxin
MSGSKHLPTPAPAPTIPGLLLILLIALVQHVSSFAPLAATSPRTRTSHRQHHTVAFAKLLSLTLEKPLGIILEEVQEGEAKGVMVQELAEGGSALAYPQLVGLELAMVQGQDVTCLAFDDVMEKIIAAPSPLTIDFILLKDDITELDIGTPVTITVIQDGKSVNVDAKVGDNLRKTLLANNVQLYRGLKKTIGNCGGNGQCTFCAVKFVQSAGWAPRSEYEEGKIGKFKDARLACMNNIQGPATIEVQ